MSVLSINEARKLRWFREYENGVYGYQTEDWFYHLIIGGKDVLAELKPTWFNYYPLDGCYAYKIEYGFYHLIIDGKDVLAGLNATDCHYYNGGVYKYETADIADGLYHLIIGDVDVLEGLNAIDCHYFCDGVYAYFTENLVWHLVIDDKDVLAGLDAKECWVFNGIYKYQTADGMYHEGKIDLKKYKTRDKQIIPAITISLLFALTVAFIAFFTAQEAVKEIRKVDNIHSQMNNISRN